MTTPPADQRWRDPHATPGARIDLSPAPGAASLSRQVLAQTRMETRLLLRNGEQLLLALVIPVLALVAGVAAAGRLDLDLGDVGGRPVDVLTPGVLALAVLSTSFTSLAIATGFERRYGLLKRLGASPLPRHGLLLGKIGAILLVELVQVAVVGAVGLALGWEPNASIAAALPTLLLGTAAFASLGLLLAGAVRAEATLAIANLVYLLLLTGGGVVFPTSEYAALGPVLEWLPSGALGEAMRAALADASVDGRSLLVLLGWAAVAAVLASRSFRWE
jgi:ABC-2 type transport system permease protein